MSFNPDWASPPGDTIATVLQERGVTKEQFADQIGLPLTEVCELLDGIRPIDRALARKLASALGATERFWVRREATYRRDLKRSVAL